MQLIATLPADYEAMQGAAEWRGYHIPQGGLEPFETLEMLVGWAGRLQAAQGWGSWVAVQDGEVVASLAIKDPARAGVVYIGYAVAPAWRGRGVATRAVGLLLPILAGHGITLVQAETALSNPASGRVMQKAGFARTGERLDPEDGPLEQWQRGIGSGVA